MPRKIYQCSYCEFTCPAETNGDYDIIESHEKSCIENPNNFSLEVKVKRLLRKYEKINERTPQGCMTQIKAVDGFIIHLKELLGE